jgi:hypothetical protein
MIEGYQSFMQNQTWDLVELLEGRKPIGYKWVFQIKHKANGGVDNYKVTLVAKGFFQTQGVNFDRTYAPMVKFISIKTMLALCCNTQFGRSPNRRETCFSKWRICGGCLHDATKGV